MQSLPQSGSRITSQLRSTNNPLVQRFLGSASVQVSKPVSKSEDEALGLLEQVLTEVESSAQVMPQVIAEATDTLNVFSPTSSRQPEQSSVPVEPEIAPELAGHLQSVEHEPTPELSPEVEGYLEAVENHAEQQPEEVVLADGSLPSQHTNVPLKKVVVLPVSEEETKAARFKNPTWSIKWLVSWSERLIKMFQGSVVYRSPE
ncbi:MAG: hypothetical protein GW946_00830 [Candidatus Pacebacteria bacterium]|nr:hypothetical protein [Candidatus Paceibacterota bacterium]PIR60842.1 MAG: hypothetical protein COU67_00085 [Candidatus Pacebacteria bacterium CG10_big_fil_rev_8_21_14_0_10_44_54]